MTVEEMEEKLNKLDVNWLEACPGSWNDATTCPDEWKGVLSKEICLKCWMKYGNINP